MASIKKLLSKRKWTGKDVGKTLIASLIHELKHIDSESSPALLTQEEFSSLEAKLDTEQDFISYRVYAAIHEALREFYNKSNALKQQIYHGFYRVFYPLQNAILAYSEQRKPARALHLTQEQYESKRQEVLRGKRAQTHTGAALEFSLLRAYFAELCNESRTEPGKRSLIPGAILKEFDALRKKKATAKKALEAWREICGEGGYILPDGCALDDLTAEEQQAALASYAPARGLGQTSAEQRQEGYRLLYEGADAIRAFYRESTGEELPPASDAHILLFWESCIGAPPLDILQQEEIATESANTLAGKLAAAIEGTREYVLEWRHYAEPADVDKLSLLEACLYDYYERKSGGYNAFKKEYPALHEALVAELVAQIKPWHSLKPAQIVKATITSGELADLGFLDFADRAEPTEQEIIAAYSPAFRARSVAFVRAECFSDVDEAGKVLEQSTILKGFTLEALQEKMSYELEAAIEALLKPAIRQTLAYNAWIDIVAQAYELPDITQAQIDLEYIEGKIRSLNRMIDMFHAIADNAKSREQIKSMFKPVDFKSLYPAEERILEAAREIEELGYTKKAERAFSLARVDDMINQIAGSHE